jgi:hypothetical protein
MTAVTMPNADAAIVEAVKVRDYLLAMRHDAGRGKARFFLAAGFTVEHWQALAAALRQHAVQGCLAGEDNTPYGRKYVIEGALRCPDGKTRRIRSVWFISLGQSKPRLVTAYPIRGPK